MAEAQHSIAQMEAALASVLSWWDEAGVETPPIKPAKPKRKTRAPLSTPTQAGNQAARQPTKAASKPAPKSAPPVEAAEHEALVKAAQDMAAGAKTRDALHEALKKFSAGSLSDGARQAVFSRGNPKANVMVIGEAPGQEEDAAGAPFIGPAGQFLDKIFASIGLNEDTLYLTNVCNWRAPNGRKPSEAEMEICRPIITRHIELIQPKIIVLIGGASMSLLTGLKGITKCRGQWEDVKVGPETKSEDNSASIPALITYHPAYLLRQPHLKRDVWRDMLALKAKIDALG